MSTTHAHILALMSIGQLSIDLRRAELVADNAKHVYHDAWRRFELGEDVDGTEEFTPCVHPEDRIRAGHKDWTDAKDATAKQFAAYQVAKRTAYNIKRRWQNAIRRAT